MFICIDGKEKEFDDLNFVDVELQTIEKIIVYKEINVGVSPNNKLLSRTAIEINNPTGMEFNQEPVEIRGGKGNEVLYKYAVPFNELFGEDVGIEIYGKQECNGKISEVVLSNKKILKE